MSKLSSPSQSPVLDTHPDEQPFAILSALHAALSGIYRPIYILESLLRAEAIPTDRLFAAHAELVRINALYAAIEARLTREFDRETAIAAFQGIQEQLIAELSALDPASLIHPYPVLSALISE